MLYNIIRFMTDLRSVRTSSLQSHKDTTDWTQYCSQFSSVGTFVVRHFNSLDSHECTVKSHP